MPIPQPDFLVTPPERINLDYAKAREKGRDLGVPGFGGAGDRKRQNSFHGGRSSR